MNFIVCIVRVIKMGRAKVRMEEGRNAFEILTRKLAGKRPIGMLRHRWEDNI